MQNNDEKTSGAPAVNAETPEQTRYPILDTINDLADFKRVPDAQLPALAEEIRGFMIENVAKSGGHLASSLGAVELILAMQDMAQTEAGLQPSLELGLVAIAQALNLPRRSAANLWAVARSIGWVAHVIEQRLSGHTIRPRARRAGG